MKRILLILLSALLILLPSCAKLPDEPVPPADSGNKEQAPSSDSGSPMTEAQKQEIIELIENHRYGYIQVEGNVETNYFYEATSETVSFMREGFETIEKDPRSFELFEDTFFYPEANGEYVYLFFKYIRTATVQMRDCVYADLQNGVLNLILAPYNSGNSDSEQIAIFKIKSSSLDSNIERITYRLETSEEYIEKLIENDKYLKNVNETGAELNVTVMSTKVFEAAYGRFPKELYEKEGNYHFATVYDETELFPESKGENIYVVFYKEFSTSGISIKKLSKAFVENGILYVDVEWSLSNETTDDMAPRLFVVKIHKATLPEEITSAKATFTYVK